MTKTLSPSEALALIREHVNKAGSQTAFAETHGLSKAYVSDTLNGRREPSKAILTAVGLTRSVGYIKQEPRK